MDPDKEADVLASAISTDEVSVKALSNATDCIQHDNARCAPVREDSVSSGNTFSPMSRRRRSTGPKTNVGKRISSRNALKHGAFSREFVDEHVLGEADRQSYKNFFSGLLDVYKPVGLAELFQIELMANHAYKYKRVLRLSMSLRGDASRDTMQDMFSAGSASEREEEWRLEIPPIEILEKLNRAESHCLYQYNRAAAELERLQRIRVGDKVFPRLSVDLHS